MQPLLCASCDSELNEAYEKRFFDLWYRQGAGPTVALAGFYNLVVPDYEAFKLFLLSILWRAGVATLKPFENVDLGEHEPLLRSMLRDRRAGSAAQYPLFGAVVTSPGGRDVTNIVSSPIATNWSGCRGYMFIFAGVAWHYLLTSEGLLAEELEWALAEDGKISMPVLNLSQLKSFERPFVDYVQRASQEGWASPWESRDAAAHEKT